MRSLLPMGAAFVVFLFLSLAVMGWYGIGPMERLLLPEPVSVPLLDVAPGHKVVTVEGTAHYPLRVKQRVKNSLFGSQYDVWLFPFFQRGDTTGREIRFLVSSPREPEQMLGFEDRRVTAVVRKPTTSRLSVAVLEAFERKGYTFADDFLLLEEMKDPDEGGDQP